MTISVLISIRFDMVATAATVRLLTVIQASKYYIFYIMS